MVLMLNFLYQSVLKEERVLQASEWVCDFSCSFLAHTLSLQFTFECSTSSSVSCAVL
jgi:hypothetical protein